MYAHVVKSKSMLKAKNDHVMAVDRLAGNPSRTRSEEDNKELNRHRSAVIKLRKTNILEKIFTKAPDSLRN